VIITPVAAIISERFMVFPSSVTRVEHSGRHVAVFKVLFLDLRRTFAMRIGGRLVGRVATALCRCGFFKCGRMIAFAVHLGGGLMSIRSGAMILSGFRVSGHWHWASPRDRVARSNRMKNQWRLSAVTARRHVSFPLTSGGASDSTQAARLASDAAPLIGMAARSQLHPECPETLATAHASGSSAGSKFAVD
jgi:hypothetical protein